MTDPIADFLTRIRNGAMAGHEAIEAPASKMKAELARILRDEGYIDSYSVEPRPVGSVIKIRLKYVARDTSAISGLRRVSRPGRRVYVGRGNLPRELGGMGTAIISTSKGVMTGHEARRVGVGGEHVASIW